MAGTKRAAEDSGATARASKVAKPNSKGKETKAKKTPAKKGPKAGMSAAAFKSKAMPLHINITHTPPAIVSDDSVPSTSADPGFLGSITLVPNSFSTGSFGWKGNKRIVVELQNSESPEKEKLQVQLTINATVLGSKPSEDTEQGKDEENKDHEIDEDSKGDEKDEAGDDEEKS